jgi:hypothetical protein
VTDDHAGSQRRRVIASLAAGLIVLAVAGGFAVARSGAFPQIWGWQRSQYHTPGPPATLSDIADVGDLAGMFNQREGVPRLVVLLSPT